jgi:cephalosporin hydroxylase
MKYVIDTEHKTLAVEEVNGLRQIDLYSDEAFYLLSQQWLKVGWNQKYPYTFSWMGRPIIQIPEDMIRLQEVIYRLQPDVILETGIAHGGSLIFSASLCKALGKGRVIGVDIDIRPPNRNAIESHPLFPYITLIEGSSIAPEIVTTVKSLIQPHEKVLAIFDSNHTKHHVLNELEAYHDLIAPGFYLVATDGSMRDLHDVPRGKTEWSWDNPYEAALEFATNHPDFELESPPWLFNESKLTQNITHWPGAWLRKRLC